MTQPAYGQPYGSFQVGGTVYPLRSDITFLQAADPAIFYMLDFYTYLIQTYVGAAMIQAVNLSGAPILAPVMQRYPTLPNVTQMAENQFKFPLLCIGRTRSKGRRKTMGWEDQRGLFDLLYSFPPLTAGQSESLVPMLEAIKEVLQHKTTQSFDANYTPPGGTAGQSPWGLQFASVEEIGFGQDQLGESDIAEHGYLPHDGNLFFPCLKMHGYILERDMYVRTGAGPFTGADIDGALASADGTVIDKFVQAATQVAPTVTGVSPATGSHLAGTAVTVTGTGFLSGVTPGRAWVLVGGYPATNVVWVSSTSITCTTPAASGASSAAVPITVLNRDGQIGVLPNAFTFT